MSSTDAATIERLAAEIQATRDAIRDLHTARPAPRAARRGCSARWPCPTIRAMDTAMAVTRFGGQPVEVPA